MNVIKSTYIRLGILLMLTAWAVLPVSAQLMHIIEVNVVQVELDNKAVAPKPLGGAEIYGFFDFATAERFKKRLKTDLTYVPNVGKDCDAYVQTDDHGFAEIKLPLNGVLVIRSMDGTPVLEHIHGRMKLTTKVTVEGRMMQEVQKEVQRRLRNKPRPNRKVGNRITIGPRAFYIDETEAKSNARFGLAPIATVLDSYDAETGHVDTFAIFTPVIKDGIAYNRSQERRMGYDLKNDSLYCYRDTNFMRTRQMDSVIVHHVLYPVDKNKHYRVYATKWFEDYNLVYSTDSVCLSEGYDQEPMRFLEFNVLESEIDTARYKRQGRRELRNETRDLYLNFATGKAKLDPKDSASFAQIEQLMSDLGRYVGERADEGVSMATIRGVASPEGGMDLNKSLCYKRALYLKDLISDRYPSLDEITTVTSEVATWLDVANELEKDSQMEYAAKVREIVSKVKGVNGQTWRIRKLPFYDYIRDNILHRLRKVEYTFVYYTNRVRTPEEIYALYESDSLYRSGSGEEDYEFYILFDLLKDRPKEMEELAVAAYKTIKDVNVDRPWPLAAYHVAQSCLKQDIMDTTLLKPYLNWTLPPNTHLRDAYQQTQGWWNDEAIVCTHIAMLCKAGDFIMADSVATNLLPEDKKFDKLRLFLDCVNEGWNDERVRDSVASTSPFNKAVVYAAQDDPDTDNASFHRAALYILQDTTLCNPTDPRVKYLEAILRFRMEGNEDKTYWTDVNFEYDALHPEDDEFTRTDFGVPMVECAKLDEKFVEKNLPYDGYFTKAYRDAFFKYWKKYKETSQQKSEFEW